MWKNFYQHLAHSRIPNKREQQNCRQQDRWILTGWMLRYVLGSVIPPLQRIQKDLPPPFLSLTYRDCRKNLFSNHIVWSHRSHHEVLPLAQKVSNFSICCRWVLGQNLYANKPTTRSVRRTVRKRQETNTERGRTRKLTIAVISYCRLCFYPVCSGKKSGTLQNLLMGKVELRVHTYEYQQALPERSLSSPCGGGTAATAAAFVIKQRVECCKWQFQLLDCWWRHCCSQKHWQLLSLSLSLLAIQAHPKVNLNASACKNMIFKKTLL